MRAVLDVNVLVSAAVSPGGTPASIVRRWLFGEFELVVSPNVLAELERALTYPKLRTRVDSMEADELIDVLRRSALLVGDPAAPRRSADEGDDYLIALAETQRAVLVSGDKHLLDLAESFPIETPADFLRRLEAQE